jgi:hypothetical protein
MVGVLRNREKFKRRERLGEAQRQAMEAGYQIA